MSAEVTAVIPTLVADPARLVQAVGSALGQRGVSVEVVVSVDGPPQNPLPDPLLTDPRVRIIKAGTRGGEGRARNLGVAAVRTKWVGFLDDDDVWYPEKLATQLPVAKAAPDSAIVSSRLLIELDGVPLRIEPHTLYDECLDISEYLLCVDTHRRVGMLQTSTLLTRTAFAARVAFSDGLPYFNDLDWVIRAVGEHSGTVLQLPDVLSVWRLDTGGSHSSQQGSWRGALAWSRSIGDLASPRARAGALLTGGARKRDARLGMPALLWNARSVGRPSRRDVVAALYLAYVPERARRALGRARARRRQNPGSA